VKTKQDRLDECVSSIEEQHGNNIEAIFGNGSYFHGSLGEPIAGNPRTIDMILIVRDLDAFYSNNEFDMNGFDSTEAVIKLRELNERSVVYFPHHSLGMRLTVIPFDQFVDWTNPGSPMGYFLRGRLQKPLAELHFNPGTAADIKRQLEQVRREAVNHAFRYTYKPVTNDGLLINLARLSYLTEGIRGLRLQLVVSIEEYSNLRQINLEPFIVL